MEPYTRESFRELMENAERAKSEKRGSVLVTLLIIAVFLFAGVFYIKTSKPVLFDNVTAFVKDVMSGNRTLETVSDALFESAQPTENETGESGDMLRTADTLCFDYIPDSKRYALLASMTAPITCMPLKNATVTSTFGDRADPVTGDVNGTHHGIDLAAAAGSEILAFKAGTVTDCGKNALYGNYVRLSHSDTLETFYGHMFELSVKVGDKVSAGDTIGIIGSTGKSTGVHLHFEIIENGTQVDPSPYLYEKI